MFGHTAHHHSVQSATASLKEEPFLHVPTAHHPHAQFHHHGAHHHGVRAGAGWMQSSMLDQAAVARFVFCLNFFLTIVTNTSNKTIDNCDHL